MEYLQVFDKEKNMLNEKISREDKFDLKDGKHFMIVVIFIENSEGKFLFQQTSSSRNSCIATTGGHVTFGDDGFKTAIKEIEEELGLTFIPSEFNYVDTFDYKNCFLEIYYVKKDININKLKLQEEEVVEVNWYSIEEINDLIKENKLRKGNIKPFEEVLKYRSKFNK